jgi:hypothetical protein
MPVEYIVALYRVVVSRVANVWPDKKKNRSGLNIDSRSGLGYIHFRRYIFVPPGGKLLLRRLQKIGPCLIEGDEYTDIQTVL